MAQPLREKLFLRLPLPNLHAGSTKCDVINSLIILKIFFNTNRTVIRYEIHFIIKKKLFFNHTGPFTERKGSRMEGGYF